MKALGILGKIIGIIFLVFVLLIIVGLVTVTIITKSNNAYKGEYTNVLESSDSSAPKALVVYQPGKSKASETAANQLAAGLNKSGYEVTVTYPGKHLSEDLSSFSLVAYGSPVFFGKPSTKITDLIKKQTDYSGKTVILYSVGGSVEAAELDVMKECLTGKKPDYTAKFLTNDTELNQKAYDLGVKAGEESRGVQ
jgi:flavorubredoxin